MKRLVGEVPLSEAYNADGTLRPGYALVDNPAIARERAQTAAEERRAEELRKGSPKYRENDKIAKALAVKVERWFRNGSELPDEVWDHIAVLACREIAEEMGVTPRRVASASLEHDDRSPVPEGAVPWSTYPAKRKKKKR